MEDKHIISSSSLSLSSRELSDTNVYEPQIKALLGPASHFGEVVDLKVVDLKSIAVNLFSLLPTVPKSTGNVQPRISGLT